MSLSEVYVVADPKWGYAGLLMAIIGITYFALDLRFHLSLLHLNLGLTRKQWDVVAWGIILLWIFVALLIYRGFNTCEITSNPTTLRLRYLLPRPSVMIPVERLAGFQALTPPKAPDARQVVLILTDGRRYVSDSSGPGERSQLLSLVARLKQLGVPTANGEKFKVFFWY